MKNREARRRGRQKTQKCPWDPFSGSALGRILRIDLGHAPSHSEEDGDLSVQATARARLVSYSLFAVLRETDPIPGLLIARRAHRKAMPQGQRPDDFCTEIKWNQRESWGERR